MVLMIYCICKNADHPEYLLVKFKIAQVQPQTTQTAHTLNLDRLSRPIVSRHAMPRIHVMFFD